MGVLALDIQMIKRACWVFLLLVPMWAGALGLQGISVASFINQPLDARIDLTALNGVGIEGVHAALASAAEFQRAGLERPYILSNLRFEPIRGAEGRAYIHVTSKSGIREPYLNFLVRVRWPGGSLLKEYAILLDPPSYRPVEGEASIEAEPVPDETGVGASLAASGRWQTYGPVRNSETLWVIAQSTRPDKGVSVEQMMMALQRANPGAFRRGNVNLLQQGAVLEIPDRAFVTKLSKREARAVFRQQTRDWRASRTQGAKPAAPGRRTTADAGGNPALGQSTPASLPAESEAPVTGAGDARLQVVESGAEWQPPAADERPSKAPVPSGGQARLKQAIIESRNDLAAVKAINHDVKALSQLLASRIEAMRKALEKKDRVITALKAQLEKAPVSGIPDQGEGGETGAIQAQKKSPGGVSTAVRIVQEEEKTPSKQAKPPAPDTAADYIAWIKAYWMPLAAVAVLFLVLLLVILLRRGDRKSELPDPDAFGSYMDMEDTKVLENGPAGTRKQSKGQGAGGGDGGDNDNSGLFLGPGTDVASALTEADIYLAYRRYSQAEALMKKGIGLNPDSWVLKAKLLEIYAFRKDRKRFSHFMEEVQPAMPVAAPEIWAKVIEMGRGLIPTHPLIVDAQLPEELAREEYGGGDMEVPADGLDILDQDLDLEREEKPTRDIHFGENGRPEGKE